MKAILNKTYLSNTKTFDTLLETVKWDFLLNIFLVFYDLYISET